MNRLSFLKAKRNKWYSGIFMIAFFFILLCFPVAIHSVFNLQQDVESNISHYARGSYDLLVRAEGNQHPLEEELGIVPENYIGFGQGGISIEQWEQIRDREDIEIAAPVAFLGYFTGVTSNFGVMFLDTSSYYETTFFTEDGINSYPVGNRQMCYLLESGIEVDGKPVHPKYEFFTDNRELLNYCKDEAPNFLMPSTYQLVVGIDPEEEEKLVGVSFDKIDPEQTIRGPAYQFQQNGFPNSPLLPVLEIEGPSPTLKANVTAATLDIEPTEVVALRERYDIGSTVDDYPHDFYQLLDPEYAEKRQLLINDLQAIPRDEVFEFTADLGKELKSFHQNGIILFEDGSVRHLADHPELFGGRYFEMYDFLNNPIYYQAGYPSYDLSGEGIQIKQAGEENGIPTYREIIKKGMTSEEASDQGEDVVILDPVDTIDFGERDIDLASSPLGIYQFSPVYGKDENGNEVELKPTLTPGSFITPPAKGVTNIESSVLVKGDQPIDAIRIKVAGITGYTDESIQKIDAITDELEEIGLMVTKIAGSSPQTMEMDVENIGTVKESWTTLGAAGTIISEWSLTNLLLGLLFVLVVLTYMLNRSHFWSVVNKKDILLYQQMGWLNRDIRRIGKQENLLLILTSIGIAVPFVVAIPAFSVMEWDLLFLFICSAISFLIFMLVMNHYYTKQITSSKGKKRMNGEKIKRKNSLVSKNLAFYQKHIRTTFVQLFLVSSLNSIVYLALTGTVTTTNVTALGEFVNVQINAWHTIILVVTYILGIITLLESNYSLLREREKEITTYLSIGWSLKDISRLLLKEIAIWSSVAVVLGMILSTFVYAILFSISLSHIILIIGVCLVLFSVVMFISRIFIERLLRRKHIKTNSLSA